MTTARLMSKQSIQDIDICSGHILLPYGMLDKQCQKETIDIHNTSKL